MASGIGTAHPLGGLGRLVRAVVRTLGLLALAAVVGVGLLAILLARGGFSVLEIVLAVMLLAPPAIVLLFAMGARELLELPERLRRMPQRGTEQMAELTRIAGETRAASWRRAPFLLWRLRGLSSSTRDLIGFALPLRVLAPPFLALTFGAVVTCAILTGVGLIALLVLAVS